MVFIEFVCIQEAQLKIDVMEINLLDIGEVSEETESLLCYVFPHFSLRGQVNFFQSRKELAKPLR